jgi:ribosomal protein S18 acetylase RimI-like enzyme
LQSGLSAFVYIPKLYINCRKATLDDTTQIIEIWEGAKLTRPWNNPNDDIKNALTTPTSTILLLCADSQIIGTVMVGYDGHRGWIYYLAVRNEFQKKGYGKQLVQEAEKWLKSRNVPKVNLMIRNSNEAVKSFYESCKYKDDEVIVMAKWLK